MYGRADRQYSPEKFSSCHSAYLFSSARLSTTLFHLRPPLFGNFCRLSRRVALSNTPAMYVVHRVKLCVYFAKIIALKRSLPPVLQAALNCSSIGNLARTS